MGNLQTGAHVSCLDMLRVESVVGAGSQFHDCAILLEIWSSGGLLQTTIAIPEHTRIYLPSVSGGIEAEVECCAQDAYGFLVQIATPARGWFPDSYTPSLMLSKPS